MRRSVINGLLMALCACALAACAPRVIYVEAPEAAHSGPAASGAAHWSGAQLRTAATVCGSQQNWVSGLVLLRDAGYQREEATAWIGSELTAAFEQSQTDANSEAGSLAIVLAAGVVESVYTEPFGTVDEELASWENACFDWLAEAMAAAK